MFKALLVSTAIMVTLVASPSLADALGKSTYAQARGLLIPPALEAVKAQLEQIDKKTKPHEVKLPTDIRKVIVKARDFVDLFAYALPDQKIDGKNAFKKLRGDLDKGYEIIGGFKDLYDHQGLEDPTEAEYDKAEVQEHRKALLDWKSDFLKSYDEYQEYVSSPVTVELWDREQDE